MLPFIHNFLQYRIYRHRTRHGLLFGYFSSSEYKMVHSTDNFNI